jgi:hypothetical protein
MEIGSDTLGLAKSLNTEYLNKNKKEIGAVFVENALKAVDGGNEPNFVQVISFSGSEDPGGTDLGFLGNTEKAARGMFRVDWRSGRAVKLGQHSVVFGFTTDRPPVDDSLAIADPQGALQGKGIRDAFAAIRAIPTNRARQELMRSFALLRTDLQPDLIFDVDIAPRVAEALAIENPNFVQAPGAPQGVAAGTGPTPAAAPAAGGGGIGVSGIGSGGGTSGGLPGSGFGGPTAFPGGAIGAPHAPAFASGAGTGAGAGNANTGGSQGQTRTGSTGATIDFTATLTNQQSQTQSQSQSQAQAQVQNQVNRNNNRSNHGHRNNVVPAPTSLLLALLGLPGLWLLRRRRRAATGQAPNERNV